MNTVKVSNCFLGLLIVVLLSGCATHPNKHGGRSVGLSVDVDTPLGGVDASVGVHNPNGGQGGQGGHGGHGGHGGGRTPCAPTHGAMLASEGLMNWASADGQGTKRRSAQASAYDSGGGAGYNCNATNAGSSTLVGGQVVGQTNDRSWLNQEQGYRSMERQSLYSQNYRR